MLPIEAPPRFKSVDDLVNRTGIRREELQTLADIGAFASFGYERREALWQVEKAIRPAGELFQDANRDSQGSAPNPESRIPNPWKTVPSPANDRGRAIGGRLCRARI